MFDHISIITYLDCFRIALQRDGGRQEFKTAELVAPRCHRSRPGKARRGCSSSTLHKTVFAACSSPLVSNTTVTWPRQTVPLYYFILSLHLYTSRPTGYNSSPLPCISLKGVCFILIWQWANTNPAQRIHHTAPLIIPTGVLDQQPLISVKFGPLLYQEIYSHGDALFGVGLGHTQGFTLDLIHSITFRVSSEKGEVVQY